jgi:hypothetical protein
MNGQAQGSSQLSDFVNNGKLSRRDAQAASFAKLPEDLKL